MLLALTAFYFFSTGLVRALNPSQPPGTNFDLSHWYLQLPTSGGVLTGTAGSVDTASTSQLVAGFTNAYFYTGSDGAMVFWTPDDGAMTSGSDHPRSELREQISPGNNTPNWLPFGTHILTATCVVSNVPSDTQKVCIGQIHENAGAGVPLAMIMYSTVSSGLYVNYWPDGNNNSSSSWGYGSFAIGSTINYQFKIVNGVLSVAINGVTNSLDLFNNGANWTNAANTVYFKAGSYNQTGNACNCSNDGARVAFYALTRYHAACITNQPASLTANAGSNATFTVGASGNSALSYQWWLNATNSLAKATNAVLTLTNVSGTNAGNYTVVVSDSTSSFSSITSAVATLTVNAGAAVAARSNYQSAIAAQSPAYYFKFDGSLVDAIGGTATLSPGVVAGFGVDYFGNASSAALFPATNDFLSLATPAVISGEGTSNAVGSLSLLFYAPNTIPTTGYYFSDSETTGSASNGQAANSALALQFSSSALTLKIGNKSYAVPSGVTVSANTWYYLALTYNLNGTATGTNGINYYLGAMGGPLASVFLQKSGSGNLSSTATLGDGLAFVVGNKQAAVVGTTSTAGVPGGEMDELATWNTMLSSNQIASQFSALVVSAVTTPQFTGVTLTNNAIQLSFTGAFVSSILVQVKTNLTDSAWFTIGTNTTSAGGFSIFTDSAFTNYSKRFYRLALP